MKKLILLLIVSLFTNIGLFAQTTLKSENASQLDVFYPLDLVLINDFAVVNNIVGNEEATLFLYEFNGDKWTLLDETSPMGEGPGECSDCSTLFVHADTLYQMDSNLKRVNKYVVRNKKLIYTATSNTAKDAVLYDLAVDNKSRFVFKGFFVDGLFTIAEQNGNKIKVFGDFPEQLKEKENKWVLGEHFYSYSYLDNKANKLICTYANLKMMDVYDYSTHTLLHRIKFDDYFENKYEVRNGNYSPKGELRTAFSVGITTNKNSIFATYSGNLEEENNPYGSAIQTIVKCNWDGSETEYLQVPNDESVIDIKWSDTLQKLVALTINDNGEVFIHNYAL